MKYMPLFIGIILFSVSVTNAATYYMPDDFPDLQAALSGISGGDTLIIRDGVYICHLILRRCIERYDLGISTSGYHSSFRIYSCNDVELQNCISIDADSVHSLKMEGSSVIPTNAHFVIWSVGVNGLWTRLEVVEGTLFDHLTIGNSLDGTASDGNDRGATVLYRIGESGTLWGETGYNGITDEPLWPFPNEDLIRDRMQAYLYIDPITEDTLCGDRGFCKDTLQLNGIDDRTLTSYIWEYLGNQMPVNLGITGETEISIQNIYPSSQHYSLFQMQEGTVCLILFPD